MTSDGDLERAAEKILTARGFEPSSPFDFQTPDGDVIVEVKSNIRSKRDLRDAAIQIALWVATMRSSTALLLVLRHGLSLKAIDREWQELERILQPKIANRIQLVAVGDDDVIARPDRGGLRQLGNELRTIARRSGNTPVRQRESFSEVVKLLVLRWLRRDPPIQIQELQRVLGLSYPTVAKALQRLDPYLRRTSSRSVALEALPRDAWSEVVVMSAKTRNSTYFEDVSGRPASVGSLLRRLERLRPKRLAVGGVIAARHWDSEFDLDGTPRLDLEIHAADGRVDTKVVERLDPALEPADRRSGNIVVAVHEVRRALPLFTAGTHSDIQWADPVETLLDLHDLKLEKQADELIHRLRRSK